jgi:hypothetical protein
MSGRVGALAVAVGVGFATLTAPVVAFAEPSDTPSPGSTALIVCGTTCPTPDELILESAMNQFITPTHPGQTITPVAVSTPEEDWPVTGLLRLIGFVTGDPRFFGPGGASWPDEPWWKLSGLFDLTLDQSAQAGVADLEAVMAEHGNDHLVICGDSQGAVIANKEKRKLAAQYPPGTTAPDIDFVLAGDLNVPNGGLAARFPGLPTLILGTFDGPEPTNTQFHTDVITRQYDGIADFPLYPLNVVADLNAVLGFLYVHTYPFDVSLPVDPTTSPAYQGTYGDSSYYFFPTEHLPLFAPLRQSGVPEPLIDVVEPFFRAIVELGYDRSIPPWEPTPARLIPPLDPVKVTSDLVSAAGEGINNALAVVGSSAPLSNPEPAAVEAVRTVDTASAVGNGAGSERKRSTAVAPENEQTSTATATSVKDEAESTEQDEVSAEATIASSREPSASDDASEPTKPKVRDSVGSDEQRSVLPKHGNRAQKAESSVAAPLSARSSSTGTSASDGDSPEGNAGGSE